MAKTTTPPPLVRPGDTLVFEGDSLTSRRRPPTLDTWPFLDLMNWHEGYADHVQRWLFCIRPDLRLRFANAAVGGSDCRQMAARYEQCVRPYKPRWVVLTLGGNDCNRKLPVAEFRDTLLSYAQRLREDSAGRLALVGGFKPCPNCPPVKVERAPRMVPYYRALREVARQTEGLYIDAGTPMLRKARLLHKQSDLHTVYSDGGHFNAVGNTIIAAEVMRALQVWG